RNIYRPSRPSSEGRCAVVTQRRARDAMDAGRASGGFARRTKRPQRTAKSCGPGAATVASSWRERSRRRRWQETPLTGESAKEAVKPLRGESRDCSAVPVVLPPVCFPFAHGTTGASGARLSLRPLLKERDNEIAQLGRNRVARTDRLTLIAVTPGPGI